jgi:hypothetical protein
MRRYVSLVLLVLFATLVFAPAAMAQMNDDQMMDDEMMSTSTSTATSMSTASALSTATSMSTASAMGDEMMTASTTATAMMGDKLPGTGGPSLAPAIAMMAGLMLMGSGVATYAFVRRATS